jgi:hypothetical protein
MSARANVDSPKVAIRKSWNIILGYEKNASFVLPGRERGMGICP